MREASGSLCRRWAENVTEMNDRWRSAEDNIDHIEAYFLPRNIGMAGVLAGGTQQAGLFLGTDGAIGSAVFIRRAGLHFHEDEPIMLQSNLLRSNLLRSNLLRSNLPSNEIDFAGAGGHAIVAGDDDDSGTPQMAMGDIFAAAAQGMGGSEVALPAMVAEDIGELVKLSQHDDGPPS
jgi:hypothetical protein